MPINEIEVVAFDGDDTLWHNETVFNVTQDRFRELMLPYVEEGDLDEQLLAVQMRNLELFGYGVKAFTLSMIETAIELSSGRGPRARRCRRSSTPAEPCSNTLSSSSTASRTQSTRSAPHIQ